MVFSLGLGLQMVFHFRNFARLERWSRAPIVDDSLAGKGAWDEIFGRLYRHEKDLRTRIAQREEDIAMLMSALQALTDGSLPRDSYVGQADKLLAMLAAQLSGPSTSP